MYLVLNRKGRIRITPPYSRLLCNSLVICDLQYLELRHHTAAHHPTTILREIYHYCAKIHQNLELRLLLWWILKHFAAQRQTSMKFHDSQLSQRLCSLPSSLSLYCSCQRTTTYKYNFLIKEVWPCRVIRGNTDTFKLETHLMPGHHLYPLEIWTVYLWFCKSLNPVSYPQTHS